MAQERLRKNIALQDLGMIWHAACIAWYGAGHSLGAAGQRNPTLGR